MKVINTQRRAYRISLLALLIAIVFVQNMVPFLGYIPVGPFSIVIIQVTVVIAAVLLGPSGGTWVGLTWGLINWIRAFVWPTSPLAIYVLVNPVISVLPRLLVGFISGLALTYMVKEARNAKVWQLALTGVIGSVINTVLVLGFMALFYYVGWLPLNKLHIQALMPWLFGIMATNGLPEAIMSGVLVPLISKPLLRFVK